MVGSENVRVVGSSMEGNQGTVTLQIPMEQLSQYAAENRQLAIGSATNLGERYGLRTDSQAISLPTERDARIKLARDIYTQEPIVANVIDLMIDFCMTGFENETEDKKAKEFFDLECKYADFDALHREIFKEYLLSSDVFILRGNKTRIKDGNDSGKDFWPYTVANTLNVTIDGPLLFNAARIGLKPNKELKEMAATQEGKKLLTAFPKKLIDAAVNGSPYYPLPEEVSRISRKRQSYERYATPFLNRVFEPVLIKRRMREADLAVAETTRQVLVTYTIGSDEFPATQTELDRLVDLLNSPNKSMELVWNHTLKVDFHFPDAALFGNEKYAEVDKDIVDGLGIPPVLIAGGGGTFATAYTSLLSVIERLDSIRDEVKRWQEAEYRRLVIAAKMKFKQIPSVQFNPLNLQDDKVFKNMILALYDRGLVSIETLLAINDFDFEVEYIQRKAEKEGDFEEVFAPRQKVASQGGRPTDKVDPGNYTPRDKQPEPDNAPPENAPSSPNDKSKS